MRLSMRPSHLLLPLALLLAGCVSPVPTDLVEGQSEVAPAPQITEWTGHVVASAIEGPSHVRPTEDALWRVQQEGFLFEITGVPSAMEVALEWEGDGEMMIMLHSHKAHGTNAYIEHVTEMSAKQPHCLRVPAEDLSEGVWQVMVHTEGVVDADFTLRIGLVEATGAVVKDELHGHWLQDGLFDVEVHDILPCQFLVVAPAA